MKNVVQTGFCGGGGETNLSSPLEFLGGLESVESESLLTKGGKTLASLGNGGGTEVPEGLLTKKKAAFTLAEVLITLGIIGVVAAMTLPAVITNVQKKVVENQLKVFNTTINNAFRMAQVEHGGKFDDWIPSYYSYSFAEMREWLGEYLFPYIKYSDVSDCRAENMVGSDNIVQDGICFHMANGALIWTHIDVNGGDLTYYVNGKTQINPRNSFQFQFAKTNKKSEFVEPYIQYWNGDKASLTSGGTWGCYKGCTNCGYCTKIIQLNNWEIPDDYPW